MAQLTLGTEETKVLAETLRSFLSDLRMEVSHTDSYDFREMLKRREEVLGGILAELERQEPEAAP